MTPAEPPETGADSTGQSARDQHLQHVLGACFGALALGLVVATVLGVWLDAPGGPVRLVDPDALVRGGCAMPASDAERTDYIGTPCDDPEATVLVLDLTDPVETDRGMPHCPAGTDALVDIYSPPLSETTAPEETDDETGDEPTDEPEVSEIACVRNLEPSHPGDPGAGGGQLVAGDCGYIDDAGEVAEVSCLDTDDDPEAQFQVMDLVDDPIDCPEGSTEKYEMWPDVKFGDDGFLMVCAVPYGTDPSN